LYYFVNGFLWHLITANCISWYDSHCCFVATSSHKNGMFKLAEYYVQYYSWFNVQYVIIIWTTYVSLILYWTQVFFAIKQNTNIGRSCVITNLNLWKDKILWVYDNNITGSINISFHCKHNKRNSNFVLLPYRAQHCNC